MKRSYVFRLLLTGISLAAGVASAQPSPAAPPAKNPTALTSKEIQAQVAPRRPASAVAPTASVAATAAPDLVAERVLTGAIRCEFGRVVNVQANPKQPGFFTVSAGKASFDMKPQVTSTGTIRLEDKAKGGVWLQLGNKSMLMNEKIGQRVADECMHPEQKRAADAMAAQPPGGGLFGAAAPAASAAASSASRAASAPASAAIATPVLSAASSSAANSAAPAASAASR